MTSKERMVATIRCDNVDYPPCSIYFNPNLEVAGYNLRDWRERLRLQIDLGCDPVVDIGIPDPTHPDVKTRAWVEDGAGSDDPVLYKEYDTPVGSLRMGVRYTE